MAEHWLNYLVMAKMFKKAYLKKLASTYISINFNLLGLQEGHLDKEKSHIFLTIKEELLEKAKYINRWLKLRWKVL